MAKKIGLALGSGSMRGFAHIGVLEVFEENEISIDCIAGSSIGAVIGGVYACGTDLKMLQKIVPSLEFREYIDPVIPLRGGFLRGDKFRELINIFTKGYDFSQTKIPFCAVAVDLLQGELLALQEGKIIDAIRASMAIPTIFEPVKRGDRLLVDGGTIARVPSATVRAMGADIVIGVDVGYRGGPINKELKRLMDYAAMASDILGWVAAEAHEKDADIMIAPAVMDNDPNSFDDFQRCVALGREAAEVAMPQIKALLAVEPPARARKKRLSQPKGLEPAN